LSRNVFTGCVSYKLFILITLEKEDILVIYFLVLQLKTPLESQLEIIKEKNNNKKR
jgi:hypothetical protein